MLRMFFGTLIGLTVAVVTIMIIQAIGHMVFPPPDIEPTDSQAFRDYINSMSIPEFLFVLASYFIGTFDGVFIGCLIARMKYHVFAILVGTLVLTATIATMIWIPHPMWFSITAGVGIIVSAWMAWFIAKVAIPEANRA